MKVKICGITNLEDANFCVELGADAIGFIFYKNSKRHIEPQIVKKMIEQLPPFLLKVGVFVNEDPEIVNDISREVKLNLVQLHGEETTDYISKINSPIIKAFRVKENFEFADLGKYHDCSFLLDTYHQKEYGGTGEVFNWKKIPVDLREKVILAGGVSVDNIDVIYSEIKPYAIDVSSSVEISPGKKDHKKLKMLFEKLNEVRK